jgi:hypothetical protein
MQLEEVHTRTEELHEDDCVTGRDTV